MFKRISVLAIVVTLISIVIASQAVAEKEPKVHGQVLPKGCIKLLSAQDKQDFIKSVWDKSNWERQSPKDSTIAAYIHALHCAKGQGHIKSMKELWRSEKKEFYEHRSNELFRTRVTPFYGGGQWWAIPYSWVVCESGVRGNDPSAPSGYYGILYSSEVPTWQSWGGLEFAPAPYLSSKRGQDIVAHRLYQALGSSPWECSWL